MAPRRVVVTGLGIISPLGLNLADNWKALSEGRPGIGPIESVDVSRIPMKLSNAAQVHGFCRAHGKPIGMCAEHGANRLAFHGIVAGCAGAVSVDVADFFRRHTGIFQSSTHGARRTFHERLRQVVCVRTHAQAANFAVDSCAARSCRFERLENHHRAAFAQDHTFAILAERSAGIRGDHAHGFPGLEHSDYERRFTAACYGHFCFTVANEPEGLTYCVVG